MFPFEDLPQLAHVGLDGFQRGIGGMGDRAILFTARGARLLLSYVDDNPKVYNHNPEQILWFFGQDHRRDDCFSVQGMKRGSGLNIPTAKPLQDRVGRVARQPFQIDTANGFDCYVPNHT